MTYHRCARCGVGAKHLHQVQAALCTDCCVVMLEEIEHAACRVQDRVSEGEIDWQNAYESLASVCEGSADIWDFNWKGKEPDA